MRISEPWIDSLPPNPLYFLAGARWVQVIAHIRNNATGEVHQYPTREIIDQGEEVPNVYLWEDGNYSCDCNRAQFFGDPVTDDMPCGSERYAVNLQNPANGKVYYRELDE